MWLGRFHGMKDLSVVQKVEFSIDLLLHHKEGILHRRCCLIPGLK
jgi:hypothetical protein